MPPKVGKIPSKGRAVGAQESCSAQRSSIQCNKEPCSHGAKTPSPDSAALPGSAPEYLLGVIKAVTHKLSPPIPTPSLQKLSSCSSKELMIFKP